MDPHPFRNAQARCSGQRFPKSRVAVLAMSFAALAGCSDRGAPTAAVNEPRRPKMNVVGADYVVTTTADAGPGSLRQAILDANAAGTAKTIAFDIPACAGGGCTIRLASSLLIAGTRLTIDGAGQGITISGSRAVRILRVASSGVATIKNLTIADGLGDGLEPDGGAVVNNGTLIVENSTLQANVAPAGGAISNAGTLTVTSSTFFANRSSGNGGAIVSSGSALVSNSTFYSNHANSGGAVDVVRGSFTISSSTFVTNTANSSRFAGTINNESGTVSISNSIITGGSGGRYCAGGVIDGGYNLDDGVTCGFSPANNSWPGILPLLDPAGLKSNGGPTQTIGLQRGSPAIEAIPRGSNGCGTTLTVDQRGYARPYGGACDIGAVEMSDATPPVITPTTTGTLGANGWYTGDVTVTWSVSDAESVVSSAPCAPTIISADTPGQQVTCSATSAGGTGSQSVTIKRDATAPTISAVVAPNPVLLNGSATATPNATDGMSGAASSSCDAPTTSAVGTKTVSCTATDNAGNTATTSASYSVIYGFTGFLGSVSPMPTVNVAKAGAAVKVAFGLGGDQGLAILASGFPASHQVSCDVGAPQDEIETTATAGNSTLSYDATTQEYGYTWKTEKAWARTCRTLTLRLVDGTTHQASFRFK